MKQKRILIICFRFPPFPGIGGRRWAKFAKYLVRKGHHVEVIASENPFENTSEWTEDIKSIPVHYLPLSYPKILLKAPENFIDKIRYRLALMAVKIKTKGNFFDTSVFWEQQIVKKSSEIIRVQDIDTIIVTVAPFRLASHVIKLRETFPKLKIAVDFRDLWTQDLASSSFSNLSDRRKQFEVEKEKEVLSSVDTVITVADKMKDEFEKISKHPEYLVIPNGFDEDEIISSQTKTKQLNEKLKLVFTGTLYPDLESVFRPFVKELVRLKIAEPLFYEKLEIEFIGNVPKEYRSYVEALGVEALHFAGHLPLKETQKKISGAHAGLLFLHDVYSFSLSTKFCEYIAFTKKIIVVSNKGETANYILENDLGYWIDPSNPSIGFKAIFKDFSDGLLNEDNIAFDVSMFSVNKLTDRLLAGI